MPERQIQIICKKWGYLNGLDVRFVILYYKESLNYRPARSAYSGKHA
jgi:hypothetical protein